MCRMRLAIGRMPPPSRQQFPECVGARPVTVPCRRQANRLERNLMGHDSARFQPASHSSIDLRQIADKLEYSLGEHEVYRIVVNYSDGPWGTIADRTTIMEIRPRIGHGPSDRVEPTRGERGLQTRRCQKIRKNI